MKYMLIMMLIIGCNGNYILDLGAQSDELAGTWLIDENYIRWGCSNQDCIPNLTNPEKVAVSSESVNYLDDDDLVVGVSSANGMIAYPHPILDWHEIINEDGYSISYCPLTGSALHISSDDDFGVSGMLYNSNLIMYDKGTNSFWPQMFLKSAAGEKRGDDIGLNPMLETTWGTWKMLYPETRVVSQNTGYSRDYSTYPYGSYKSDQNIYFPISHQDGRLHPKKRVLGVVGNSTQIAFPISDMSVFAIHHQSIGDEPHVIIGSAEYNFATAFKTDAIFQSITDSLNNDLFHFTDTETGSTWNLFGKAVSGELMGSQLEPATAYIAYWFAWAAFYPQSEIIEISSQ